MKTGYIKGIILIGLSIFCILFDSIASEDITLSTTKTQRNTLSTPVRRNTKSAQTSTKKEGLVSGLKKRIENKVSTAIDDTATAILGEDEEEDIETPTRRRRRTNYFIDDEDEYEEKEEEARPELPSYNMHGGRFWKEVQAKTK